jgi:hypothetical protein
VETIEQLKEEIENLSSVLEGANNTEASLEISNSAWLEVRDAQNKMPGLLSMLEVVVDHLEQLERSSERHRILAHEHLRNGDTSMSMRAKTLAHYESRIHALLLQQLMNAWNDSQVLQEESR